MSKTELKIWAWLLGISGIATLLVCILPVTGLILLLYLFVGMIMIFCPFIFLYSSCAFALNGLLALIVPRPYFWLRIGFSVVVVVMGAHLVSAHLNTARTAVYKQVEAQDVALAAKPVFSRLVLVDDRHEPGSGLQDCDTKCIAYLANGATQAVLLPVSTEDTQPLEQRDYGVFGYRSDCEPAKNFNDVVDRVWEGGCLTPEKLGGIEAGDLIVHAMPFSIPFQSRKCHCERIEVFLMTASGLKLIERQTSFEMTSYGDMPAPGRDAGWNGSYYDRGISWTNTGGMIHRRYYENVLKDDLGLSPDVNFTPNHP